MSERKETNTTSSQSSLPHPTFREIIITENLIIECAIAKKEHYILVDLYESELCSYPVAV